MKNCRRAKRAILRESDQELSVEEAFFLEEHVAQCPGCRHFRDVEATIVEAMASSLEPIATDNAVRDAVSRIQGEVAAETEAETGGVSRRRWIPAAAAAALILTGAILWEKGFGEAPSTTLEESEVLTSAAAASEPPSTVQAAVTVEARDADGVRSDLRRTLLAAVSEDGELEDTRKLLERFDAAAIELDDHWPIVRFVEELVEDPDTQLARAAIRVLGARGDRISVSSLRRALAREELGPDVVTALGAMGETGLPGLVEALQQPHVSEQAILALANVGGETAARALEASFESTPEEGRGPFLDAFASMGPCSLPALLRLADRGAAPRALLLSTIERTPQAASALVPLLRNERLSEDLRFEAAERLPSTAALEWLESRVLERFSREPALASLSRWEGVEPLEALVRLAATGRLSEERIYEAVRDLLERDAERAEALAREYVSKGSQGARELLELLIASGAPHSGGACAVLTRAKLHEDERLWAALAAADLGVAEDAATLADSFLATKLKERRLRAALLLAIHRLEGEQGVLRVLNQNGLQGWDELHRVLEEAQTRGPAVSLHRVVRALDDVDARSPNPWKST